MNRFVHLSVVCMLVMGVLQTVLPTYTLDAEASPPPPDDGIDGVQYIEGDWYVNGSLTYKDEIIIMSGNITVAGGSSLTLINVTLAMNCTTQNGLYTIEVLSGGSLIITDGDNDPATMDDRSNITDSPFDTDDRSPSDYRTAIKVYSGGLLSINNSIIRECGYSGGGNDIGLYIDEADNINIQNSTFENNLQAIYLFRSDNSVIAYNEIRNSDEYGLNIVWNNNLRVFNNNIHHNDFGAFIGADYSWIYNNYIHNNSNVYSFPPEQDKDGLRIWWSDNTEIYNNTIEYNGGTSWSNNLELAACNDVQIYNNTIRKVKPGSLYAVYLYNIENMDFHNNSLVENDDNGLRFGMMGSSKNNRFMDNNISDNLGYGLYLESWGDGSEGVTVEVRNNLLNNNTNGIFLKDLRTYNIQNNLITSCNNLGVYVRNVKGGEFSNNTITATNDDIVLRDSNTFFKVLNCTFDSDKINFVANNPVLEISYFLHLNVTDATSWVPGAYVEVRNETGVIVFTGYTDDNGRISYIVVKNQTMTVNGNTSYDPYNITATLDIFKAYGEIEPVMNVSQTVNVIFNADLPPTPPSGLTTVSNGTNVDLDWVASPSTDVDHYLVYRNATGPGYVIVYNSSLFSPYELNTNWTDPKAASDWSTYYYYVVAVDAVGQPSGPTNIAFCGDWVVDSGLGYSGLTVKLNGSLIILPTGNLTLSNVKIQFNNSFEVVYGIEVMPNAKFWILDGDNDPQTTGDRSEIAGAFNSTSFFIMNGAEFVMRNSKLSYCGRNDGINYGSWTFDVEAPDVMQVGEPWTRGLYIGSPGAAVTIENNDFSDNFVTILIDNVNDCTITGNTFFTNTFGIYINNSHFNFIDGNTFTNHQAFPVYMLNSGNQTITFNDFNNTAAIQAGLMLYGIDCLGNTIINNNFTGNFRGVYIYNGGDDNNISSNYFYDIVHGIQIYYTSQSTVMNNRYTDVSSIGIRFQGVGFSSIQGEDMDLIGDGLYIYQSNNLLISEVNVENASSSGVYTYDSNNIQMRDLSITSCDIGIYVSAGDTTTIINASVQNSTTGFLFSLKPTNLKLITSTVSQGTVTAIEANACDNIIIINCSLDATLYNFDLTGATITLYNTTYNQTRVILNPSSSISLWWYIKIHVRDWFDDPVSVANVQIRKPLGTLVFNEFTDSNGDTRWIWLLERTQYAFSNETSTPYFIQAFNGTHSGSVEFWLNQSTVVTVILENTAPSVSNAIITPSLPTTVDDLNLTYLYSDPENDPEGSIMILWYTDGIHNTTFNNQTEINRSYTIKGQTWFSEVIPHDGAIYGIPMVSTPVSIQNTPSVVSNVSIMETAPTSSDFLHIAYNYSDIDGDSEGQSQYRWHFWNGTDWVYSGVDSLELDPSFTAKGELWKCIVTPHDGDDLGNPIDSNVVTIGNSAPEVMDVVITPLSPMSNETLNVSYTYFDLDLDLESGSMIRWYKNSTEQAALDNSTSVDSSLTQKGETWYYIITPYDGEDFGIPIQSNPVYIGNTPPYVSNITLTPIDPTTEDDLNVSYDYSDNDGDSESLDTIVRWLRWNGMEFFDTGLRGKTLPSEHTFKGEIWTCEVIPHDGWNEGTPTLSDMNVTIVNSAPFVINALILPPNPISISDLLASYQYVDLDFDLQSGSLIRWYQNDVEQIDLNDSLTVSASRTQKGDVWYYIVTPSDGEAFGATVKSVNATIGNTPPSVSNITISPLTPDTEDVLTVSYDFFDIDGDSESLDTVIKWLRWSGSDFFDTGHRGRNLSAEITFKGEIWTCEVIPHDDEDEGLANRSDMNVTIINSAPTILGAEITPPDPTSVMDLTASYDYWDVDFDLESGSLIRWYQNDVEQVDLNDSITVSAMRTIKGDIWYYLVTPSDGEDLGTPFKSDNVTIGNTPPSVSNITVSPLNPKTGDVLTVSYDFYDIDGDSESLDTTVKWLRWDGADFFDTGYRGKNLSSDHTQKGELWTCEVIPHDGEDEGAATRSGMNVTIVNSAPTVLTAVISPASPTAESNLTASYSYYDVDGDADSGSLISWFKDDIEQVDLAGNLTVNASRTQKGEVWYYVITPSDGMDFGTPVQSENVTIGNTPPTVSNITISPLNPTTVDDLTASYDFNDTDGDSESLDTVVRWLRWDINKFIDTGLRGKTLSSGYTARGDIWTCEVVPHDGLNEGTATRSDMNVTIGNTAPSILSASITPSDPPSDSNLTASYSYYDVDGDSESGSIIRWYKNDVEQWGLNDSFSVTSSLTQPGEIWHYAITPSDGIDVGVAVRSENVTIGNTPPYASNITISPSNPDTEDDLSVTYDYYDVEGNSESLDTVVRWLRWDIDKFIDTGHRGKTLSSDYTSQGETWTCEVIPHDGLDEGTPTRSSMNVTVQNTVPTVLSAVISPSSPTADSDISASYNYYDVDGDFESGSTIRWFQNDVEQLDLNDNFTINRSRTLKGDIWYYIITPSDGLGFGTPFKSENKTIGNTPPYVTNITISPVDPITEDDLSASYDYYDSDGDSESLDTVIKWLRWSGSDFFDTGHRGRNLSSEYTAKGDIWTCEVVPHDGGDEGPAIRSGMNVTIGNSAPTILDAQITPVNPTAADDLSAGYIYYDVDSDPESGSMIHWFRNAIEQTDLNGSISVNSARTQKGDTWYYIITPSDGEDYGAPVQSDASTIGNTPPQVSNLAISPLNPSTGDDLVASYDYYDSDGDAESLDTTVKWLLWSGITFIDTGYRGKTLSSTHTSKGDIWTCEVIPHDGEDEGSVTQGAMNVTIANSAPSVTDAVISPSDPTSEDDLTSDYEYLDVDSDPESGSLIRWFRNGIEQVDLLGSVSVNYSRTQKGEGWYYIITPYDGEDYGAPVQSDSVIIGNTPPSVFNITITPLNPTTQDDLTVTYDFYDGDGDSESLDTTVRWLRWSGTDFVDTGFRGKTLSPSQTSKGELWTCEISPHDGVGSGATATSGIVVTILNSRPTATNLHITPQEPTSGNDLVANYDYHDLDSDPESGSEIMWFRDGVHVPALDNQSLVPHSMTAKGQTWNFSVHPNDNFEFGDWVDSGAVTIQNTPPSTTNLSITPNPPLGDDDLMAVYTYFDDDGDSQSSYEIRWYKNVFVQELYTDQLQVESSATGKDELWSFTLRVYDGEDWSETFTSHYVVIENSRPIINSISPSAITLEISETGSLEFFVDAEDPDDDLLIYRWKLGKTTVGSDDYYLFQTDYESEGVYTLNLTVQDFGERSYSLYYEWVITVNNVNRLPELEVTEPLTKTPKMEEDTSLRFLIDETDPDSGDTLDITWYFDDVVAQEGGSSYTYHADFTAAGDHEVKVVVDDSTDSSEYSWNLTVADIAQEELLGYSYDWWGLVLAIMSGVVALLLATIGLMRVKKKKGALKKYMTEIDEMSKDMDLSPEEYEERLSDIEARINDEFKQGQIEDLHYLMLQEIIASKRGEARKAEVASMFGRLPAGVVRDLDNMLKDGKITPEEYEGFVATISMTESLTPDEKEDLSKVIEKWEVEDEDITSHDSQSTKDKLIKDELDEIDSLENDE